MDQLILFFLLYVGLGIGATRLIIAAFKEGIIKLLPPRQDEPPALTDGTPPAVPPRRTHPLRPIRDPDDEQQPETANMEESEKFFRFAYVITRLQDRVDVFKLKATAESFQLPLLLITLEQSQPESEQLKAVIATFQIRTWPDDVPALVDVLRESPHEHVVVGVLEIFRQRGPENLEVVIAVYDLIYGDYKDSDRFLLARRTAEDIFSEWEEKHPYLMQRFGLLE